MVKNEKGELDRAGPFVASRHSCTRPNASVRKKAFHKYYAQFDAHKNTIAATLNGSVQRDVYYAKARNYQNCARSRRSFADNVPVASTTT